MNCQFEENPNPNGKIAFVMWTPFHYYVYKNIAKHLPESEFVVCDTWFKNKFERGTAHLADAASFLSGQKVHWRVLPELDDGVVIEKFFDRYEIIVATFPWSPLDSLSFDDWFSKKKSVRMLYGTTKNLATFAPWSAQFDLALTYGPHSQNYLQHLNEAHMVGLPKFDDWFNRTLNMGEIEAIRKTLDLKKKTILYLPTHSKLSSLYKFGDAMLKLGTAYNILTKFHQWSGATEENIWVNKYKNNNKVRVFGEKDDILSLFSLADIIVSDTSSVAFDAMLINKPLVILDVTTDDELMKKHYSGEEFNGLWYSGGLMPEKGIYEEMKKEHPIGEIISTTEDIREAVDRAEEVSYKYQEARNYWKQRLFSYNDGKCGERAAAVIKGFLDRDKPVAPLLGEAIRAYFTSLQKNYRFQMQKIIKENQENYREIEKQKEIITKLSAAPHFLTKIKTEKNFFRKAALVIKYMLN